MLCMVLYYLIVRMPLAGILSALGFGLNGIWFAVLVSHLIAAAAAAITLQPRLAKNEARHIVITQKTASTAHSQRMPQLVEKVLVA